VPQADSEKLAAIGKREREESARKSKEQREQNEVRKARLYQERKLWEEGLPALCERWRKGELASLREQLTGVGFSKRAIATAFKNALRENV
jgi:hypothetical protein